MINTNAYDDENELGLYGYTIDADGNRTSPKVPVTTILKMNEFRKTAGLPPEKFHHMTYAESRGFPEK